MRINGLKVGQGISLIFEKAQTSAQIFAKLFNSKVNERVDRRARRGCRVWLLVQVCSERWLTSGLFWGRAEMA